MDDCELDILSKELESDFKNVLNTVDCELEKKSCTIPYEDYELVQKIGQGTFGEVFKMRHKKTKQLFALKRLKIEHETEGFCEHDLAGLLSHKVEINLPIAKSIMKQLLTGLYFIHKNNVLHRDLKASNILINKAGVLKIADFGLARFTVASTRADRPPRYTGRVVTLWYRPPEILLDCRQYGRPVDMWGAGCIMAELWTMYPIMQGNIEVAQLNLIIQLCGSITPEVWPGVQNLEAYKKANFPKDVKRHVREKLTPQIPCPSAIDLIDKLLVLDPAKRLTADQALNHDFFIEDPQPGDLTALSKNDSSYLEFLGQQNRNRHPQHANARYNAIQGAGNFHRQRHLAPGTITGQPGQAGAFRANPTALPYDQEASLFDRVY